MTTTSSSCRCVARSSGSRGSPGGASVTTAASSSRLTTIGPSSGVMRETTVTSGPPASRSLLIARGTSEAVADGTAPRTSEAGRAVAVRAASRPRRASLTTSRACGSSALPAAVGVTPRGPRSSRRTPTSRSSAATCRDSPGWVKPVASAAARIEPVRQTSTNAFQGVSDMRSS